MMWISRHSRVSIPWIITNDVNRPPHHIWVSLRFDWGYSSCVWNVHILFIPDKHSSRRHFSARIWSHQTYHLPTNQGKSPMKSKCCERNEQVKPYRPIRERPFCLNWSSTVVLWNKVYRWSSHVGRSQTTDTFSHLSHSAHFISFHGPSQAWNNAERLHNNHEKWKS
jgi:hypothetical protein